MESESVSRLASAMDRLRESIESHDTRKDMNLARIESSLERIERAVDSINASLGQMAAIGSGPNGV